MKLKWCQIQKNKIKKIFDLIIQFWPHNICDSTGATKLIQ